MAVVIVSTYSIRPYFDKKHKDGNYINNSIMLSILRLIGCIP